MTRASAATDNITGTTFNATGQISISTSGAECPGEIPDQCMNFAVDGTRIGACTGISLHQSVVDLVLARAPIH